MNKEPRLRKSKRLLLNVAVICLIGIGTFYLLPFLSTVVINYFSGLSEMTNNDFFSWLGVAVAWVICPLGAIGVALLILATIQRRQKTRNQE